jgi:flagellin-like hook-associated protein FlgL
VFRESTFVKEMESMSLSGGLGYLERLRDENMGLGVGFSYTSQKLETTQTTDSVMNQESKIMDQLQVFD